ncbi:hypothetical protein P4S65_19305 [Pseudoalteromonas sp. B131b]|uniref:hypothetical protein n=1 Tax=Pseudoalteromonas sp. B131b TaxID=630493 RepID=UPI00301E04C0
MNSNIVNSVIDNFRQALISGVHQVERSYEMYVNESNSRENEYPDSFNDYFDDWAQCLWELLVERTICAPLERLRVYGEGSDYNPNQYSHVFFQDVGESHEIICRVKKDHYAVDVITGENVKLEEYQFMRFAAFAGGWFKLSPPFDHVQLDEINALGANYKQILIPFNLVEFEVIKIST